MDEAMWLRWWYQMAGEIFTYLLVSTVIVTAALYHLDLLPAPIRHRLIEIWQYIFGTDKTIPEKTKPTTSPCSCSYTTSPSNNTSRTSAVSVYTTAAPSTQRHPTKGPSHEQQILHHPAPLENPTKAKTTPNSPASDNPTTHMASKSDLCLKTAKSFDRNNNKTGVNNERAPTTKHIWDSSGIPGSSRQTTNNLKESRTKAPITAKVAPMTANVRMKMLSTPVAADPPPLEPPMSAMAESSPLDEASRPQPHCSDCIEGGLPYSPVTFRWANGGEHVYLVGSFTNWDTRTPMQRVRSKDHESISWHTVTMLLPHGHHEYKFVVDGEYRVDPTKQTVATRLGDRNNLIHVYED